jgi:hypothetical protein
LFLMSSDHSWALGAYVCAWRRAMDDPRESWREVWSETVEPLACLSDQLRSHREVFAFLCSHPDHDPRRPRVVWASAVRILKQAGMDEGLARGAVLALVSRSGLTASPPGLIGA